MLLETNYLVGPPKSAKELRNRFYTQVYGENIADYVQPPLHLYQLFCPLLVSFPVTFSFFFFFQHILVLSLCYVIILGEETNLENGRETLCFRDFCAKDALIMKLLTCKVPFQCMRYIIEVYEERVNNGVESITLQG